MSISSEASMARSTDKDDTSDSSWQHPISQTANTDEQSKSGASGSDGTDVASDTSEKEPEKSDMTNNANAAHNKRIGPAGGKMNKSSLSARAHRSCNVADGILGSMSEVEKAMAQLYEYVKSQSEDNKPLYQWARFDGYHVINRALTDLDEAAARLEEAHLSVTSVELYVSRATRISLAVSQIAVFSMGVMGEKVASCIDEIEESTLSAEGKVQAQTVITEELKRLLNYCARTTDRVYAALDLLRNLLHIEDSYQNSDTTIIKELIAKSEARLSTPHRSWLWNVAKVVLGVGTSAIIAITAAHLYNISSFDLALQANPNSMHSQIMSLVQRAQAVTNLTSEIYSIKLADLDQRYNELEGASESHGLRIDNLVEALGVPNEDGTYFSSMPKPDCQTASDIPAIAADADRQIGRLRSELELMRKNIHRMDIRLMKRLDKVDRRGL